MRDLICKQYRVEVKGADDAGMCSAYASVFGVVDSDNEVVDKGAFKRTIDHKKGIVPVLWMHDRKEPVGWGVKAEEDGRGLLVTWQNLLACEKGRYAHDFVKTGMEVGAKVGISVGFRVPQNGSYFKDGVRHFREVELIEYSIVTFPANPEAAVTSAKHQKNGVPMKFKAEDFNSSLAEAQAMSDLNELRWTMESALRDAIGDICENADMAIEDKKAAISESLDQYAEAMAAWWGKWIDATSADGDDDEPDDIKSGKTISAATAKALQKASDYVAEAVGHGKMAMTAKTKAIGVISDLATGRYANDVNKPNPVGGGKSAKKSAELKALADSLATLKFQ